MNIRDLKCFQIVYENKSINSAAKQLYITSQGLGRIISNLERELETNLFERSAKGLRPTVSAKVLYEHSRQLISQFELIEHAIRQADEQEKKLKIFCARGVLNALSFQVLSDFIKKHPQIEVVWKEMANDQVRHAVSIFSADIGLVVGKTEQPKLHEEFLNTKKMCILVYKGHPFFEREDISIKELSGEKIITLSEQYRVYHDFTNACKEYGIDPEIVGTTEDSHFLYKMCKQKNGLGVLLDFSVDDFVLNDLKTVPLKEDITWDIYMICQKKNLHIANIELFRRSILG